VITSTARSVRLAALSVSFVLFAAASSFAQTARGQSPRSGSWEIGGGIVYLQGFDMGDQNADLTRPTGDPLELFSTSSELKAAIGLQGRLGFYLSPQLSVEGGVRYAKPKLSIRITGDFENAPNETAEETLNQYLIDGSALWHFGRLSATSGGVVPFIMGGVGYIRELHDGQELVETGVEYHAGAGVKVWFGGGGARFGLRAEGGISIRDGGFDFEDKTRYMPVAAGSVIYLF
jgi:Outer membrane protein beta-barrel domain